MKKSKLRLIIKEEIRSLKEFKIESLMDLASEVYSLVDEKDLENKSKIKSALKKLGAATDAMTIGRVIRKIQDEL